MAMLVKLIPISLNLTNLEYKNFIVEKPKEPSTHLTLRGALLLTNKIKMYIATIII